MDIPDDTGASAASTLGGGTRSTREEQTEEAAPPPAPKSSAEAIQPPPRGSLQYPEADAVFGHSDLVLDKDSYKTALEPLRYRLTIDHGSKRRVTKVASAAELDYDNHCATLVYTTQKLRMNMEVVTRLATNCGTFHHQLLDAGIPLDDAGIGSVGLALMVDIVSVADRAVVASTLTPLEIASFETLETADPFGVIRENGDGGSGGDVFSPEFAIAEKTFADAGVVERFYLLDLDTRASSVFTRALLVVRRVRLVGDDGAVSKRGVSQIEGIALNVAEGELIRVAGLSADGTRVHTSKALPINVTAQAKTAFPLRTIPGSPLIWRVCVATEVKIEFERDANRWDMANAEEARIHVETYPEGCLILRYCLPLVAESGDAGATSSAVDARLFTLTDARLIFPHINDADTALRMLHANRYRIPRELSSTDAVYALGQLHWDDLNFGDDGPPPLIFR